MKPLERAESIRVMHPLFQTGEGGSTPTSALHLRFDETTLATAKALNKLWHSRMPNLTSPQCRVAYAAHCDGVYYAAAVWCRPIARLLPQYEWIELQRFAIAPDAPRNTASRMLAWMTRDITRRHPEISRLISYQDTEVHTGSIYRAAGWKPLPPGAYSDWNRAGRARRDAQSTAPKIRWELIVGRNNSNETRS